MIKNYLALRKNKIALFCILVCMVFKVNAQTDIDAIMMGKNKFCGGLTYMNGSWNKYWEGTFKRDNQNLGTVTTQSLNLMGNYGISSKLNVLFNVPYMWTHASAGTLHGMKGFQDLSLWLKWMPVETGWGNGTFSLYAMGGFSTPLSNYTPDFLPMSIGLHSTTLSGRLMADYQTGNFFVTGSGTYTYRENITIDRNSYYTTQEILSNKVEMPNVASMNFRTGYRSYRLIAEAVFNDMITLGGFDIRKNDMPFPSNKMNAASVGVNFKYEIPPVDGLSVTGGADYVVAGRNVGQSRMFNIGIFYVLDFNHHLKPTSKTN